MDTIGGGGAFSSAQISEEISQGIVHDCLKSTCLPLSPNSMLGCYAGLLEAFLGGRLTGRNFASRHYYKSFNIEIGGEGALQFRSLVAIYLPSTVPPPGSSLDPRGTSVCKQTLQH